MSDKENERQQTQTATAPAPAPAAATTVGVAGPSAAVEMPTSSRTGRLSEKESRPERVFECVLNAKGFVTTRVFLKGKFLGKGGFARCYEMLCEETGKRYAGKIVAKSSLVKAKAKQKFTSEIKIHKALHHRHVVQFEHFFEDSENAYILLELCRNQSLSDLLRRRKRLSEGEVRFYVRQLVQGLAYLHSNLVIHRDLKLGNLFLTSDMELKIGDFGLATRLDNVHDRKRTMCGTPNYIAPEILSGQKGDGHSFEVDIWSTGVVMYTLLMGRPPFETEHVKDTYKRIRANEYTFPETVNISEAAQSLIKAILQSEPHLRPSLDAILSHPFLRDEPIPSSLPKTALLITPPSCKPGALTSMRPVSRRSLTPGKDRPSSKFSTRGSVAPHSPRRYPLRSRDINSRGIINRDRVLRESRVAALAKAAVAGSVGTNLSATKSTKSSEVRSHPSLRASSSSSSSATSSAGHHQATPVTTPLPQATLDTWETVYELLERLFALQQHSSRDEKLSKFSSANTIVAAAKRLKQDRLEATGLELTPAKLWVSQWVDYTSKYGMGYALTNGSSGVYFNDSTKIIASPDSKYFEYFERNDDPASASPRKQFSVAQYDASLSKKVALLGHFNGYLNEARTEGDEASTLERLLSSSKHSTNGVDSGPLAVVTKWVKTRHAALFCLSNNTCQMSLYDSSKLVLTNGGRCVTYVDREGTMHVLSTSTVILKNEKPDLIKRLKYAREMLEHMIVKT